jgi:hypothetical protein
MTTKTTAVLLIACTALTACGATQARQQFEAMQHSLAGADAAMHTCLEQAKAHESPAAKRLGTSAAQLADNALPTPTETQQLEGGFALFSGCFTAARAQGVAADSALAAPLDQFAYTMNTIGAELIRRHITYAEASRRLHSAMQQREAAVRAAHKGTVDALVTQHHAELRQRERVAEGIAAGLAVVAAGAAAGYAASQPVYVAPAYAAPVYVVPQPVQLSCVNMGSGMTDCRSY